MSDKKTTPKKDELKELLDTYGNDLKKMSKVSPKDFKTAEVATMITSLPERKWNAAQAIIENTKKKKEMDRQLKTIKATRMMEASKKKDTTGLSSAADRAAWVENQPGVEVAEMAAIEAEAMLLASKLGYECLDDLFTAGKKIMDWLTDQERAQRQYDRFANEGKKNQ